MTDGLTPVLLRGDLVTLTAATFIASLGLAALALFALRWRAADITPLAFAAFALLYALRLAFGTKTLQLAAGDRIAWDYVGNALTYAILPAGAYFSERLLGTGWRGGLRWLRRVTLALAPIAIAGMFATRVPEWFMRVNNLLVLAFLLLVGLTVAGQPAGESPRALKTGVAIAAAFIVGENLRAMGLLPWPAGIEFVGVAAFMAALAFGVADRFLRTEGRLAAVDRELAMARRIQQAILPDRVPHLPRFRIAVRYIPMTEVAGDFYDFVTTGDASTTAVVADVSGHGVPAALIASMVKVTAASHARAARDPGALLSAMSGTLTGHLGGQFLTAMCVQMEADGNAISYAGAGHPPLLHWHADQRRLDSLPSEGILIGLVPSTYSARQVPVRPGDWLLACTDGVLEAAAPDGAFFGDERLATVITELVARPGADLAQAIVDAMIAWSSSSSFADDVTVIAIEVLPES
jgi:sigma-B regulation protein RsbU (phosphoserine phosphatase)